MNFQLLDCPSNHFSGGLDTKGYDYGLLIPLADKYRPEHMVFIASVSSTQTVTCVASGINPRPFPPELFQSYCAFCNLTAVVVEKVIGWAFCKMKRRFQF